MPHFSFTCSEWGMGSSAPDLRLLKMLTINRHPPCAGRHWAGAHAEPGGTAWTVRPRAECELRVGGGRGAQALRDRALHLLRYCAALAWLGPQATAPAGAGPGRGHHDTMTPVHPHQPPASAQYSRTRADKHRRVALVGCWVRSSTTGPRTAFGGVLTASGISAFGAMHQMGAPKFFTRPPALFGIPTGAPAPSSPSELKLSHPQCVALRRVARGDSLELRRGFRVLQVQVWGGPLPSPGGQVQVWCMPPLPLSLSLMWGTGSGPLWKCDVDSWL